MRVGTNQESECDVRIIAATNRNPQDAVIEGKLREDLYHRLNVFPIHLPPLRERARDVELLAQSFLDLLNEAHRSAKVFSPAMLACMASHAWPGNVRELKNYVHRAFIMTDGGLIDAVAAPIQLAPAGKGKASPSSRFPWGCRLPKPTGG